MATKPRKAAKPAAPAAKKTTRKKKPATRRKAPVKAKASAAGAVPEASPPAASRKVSGQPAMLRALYAEHRHMASVMRLFSEQLDAIEAGELVDTHVVYEIMDYMVSWPDRFHHPREDLIYGRAAELDSAAADNVDSLQRDHDQMSRSGDEVLRNIQLWRDGEMAGRALVKSGRAYVDHLYEHMNSEEQVVFPQIERIFSAEDWRELALDDRLLPIPDPVFGPKVQREFRNMARKLRTSVRRGVERGTLVEWLSVEALMESLEVVSMAYESARSSAGDHARIAWDEGLELWRESVVTAPWRCAANNTRLGFRLLQEVAEISRDAMGDLSRVNQERKDRIRLLDS